MLSQWIEQGELRPCRVLLPGCGRGHEAIALAELGFDVTAVDFADTAVQTLEAELRQRNLQATVIQSDLRATEVALIRGQSHSYSIKWYSYSQRAGRVRVPAVPEYGYGYENQGLSRISLARSSKSATSKLTRRVVMPPLISQ